MKKKIPINRLKKKLWRIFSEYIRRKYSDLDGNVVCITCGKRAHWSTMQASHFLDGRNNGILFVEANCHPACMPCNIWKHGNKEEYYPFMLETYGQETINALKRLKKNPQKLNSIWYEDKIQEYKSKLEAFNRQRWAHI